jgi:hypothetical protein
MANSQCSASHDHIDHLPDPRPRASARPAFDAAATLDDGPALAKPDLLPDVHRAT